MSHCVWKRKWANGIFQIFQPSTDRAEKKYDKNRKNYNHFYQQQQKILIQILLVHFFYPKI